MSFNKAYLLENFFIAGVNYKNTDAVTRGKFSISERQYENVLELASSAGIEEMFVLSTCNRTEIYALAKNASQLIELLCSQISDDFASLSHMIYIKNGADAISHLYNVGSGLDSQILGDYEIVSQLKHSVKFSRNRKFIGSFLDRLVNSVLQSSKKIKTYTSLSSGSVSVSFSAVKYIKEKTNFTAKSKILVLGAGKIGRNTCKNLADYFSPENITVINRSEEKAVRLAHELSLQYAPISQLSFKLEESDIIIVATNATEPFVLKSQLERRGEKVIIDLSIPCNVEGDVNTLSNITLIHVDQISKLKDESLKKREAEIPKAKKIIEQHLLEFVQWYELRKNVPVLKSVKTKLRELQTLPLFCYNAQNPFLSVVGSEQKAQQVINGMAKKLLSSEQRGCHYIEAINEYIMAIAN